MKNAADIRPFLPSAASPTRPLAAALPSQPSPPVTSPWLPRAEAEAAPAAEAAPVGPSPAELEAIYEQARTAGRSDGLAETAALRERLAVLLAELAAARTRIVAPASELVSDVASCVIEAWLDSADRGELFAPIVRAWGARAADQPATARVHPSDVAALTAAIGDAKLTIVADPALAAGALEIASPTLELALDWRSRMSDLRTAITSALSGTSDGEPPGGSP